MKIERLFNYILLPASGVATKENSKSLPIRTSSPYYSILQLTHQTKYLKKKRSLCLYWAICMKHPICMKHQYSLQYHRSNYMRHISHVLMVNLNTLLATCHLQSKFIHEPSYMDMYTCFHFTCYFHPTSKFNFF